MKSKITTWIFTMTILSMTALSCKENKNNSPVTEEPQAGTLDASMDTALEPAIGDQQSSTATTPIVKAYLQLKEELVADDAKSASETGEALVIALKQMDAASFSTPQKSELRDIIENATKHATAISKATLDLQRVHFKLLSADMMDMVAITGSPVTLYEQFCPMYDNGSAWLSANKEIKNPYYGSKMLNCGVVKATIE